LNVAPALTEQQLDMLRHMLGINHPEHRVPRPYRNYAAVEPGDPRFVELEALGMVERYRAAGGNTEYDWYRCTEAGQTAALRSHPTIRLSKSKRVYIRFLDLRDAYSYLTFKEFLTLPEFAQARREA
jgi:hypothetical protein